MPTPNKIKEYAKHQKELEKQGTFLPISHDMALGNFYSNVDPGVSVRPPYTRENYEFFRPNEATFINPKTQDDYRKIMVACKSAYERVGVVRSVVDMMSEFGAEGVEIVHPDEGPNNFYKAWMKRVKLEDRTERFLSWFYKAGNVAVRRKFGQL